jgi:hypothetical protein
MASIKPDPTNYRDFADSIDVEPPRQRGCLFYGCLISAILAVLLLIALGLLFFFVYRWFGGIVNEYTATAPRILPTAQVPADERRSIRERVDRFHTALDNHEAVESLVLSSDDINVLIENRPELKGKFYITVVDDKLKAKVSLPLNDFPTFGLTQGRYLNGEAEIKAFLRDGIVVVTLQSLEVDGKQVPERFMAGLRSQNLARDIHNNEKIMRELQNVDSIEIQDGHLIIKPKRHDAGGKSATPAATKEPAPERSPAKPDGPDTPAGKPATPDGGPADASPA